MAEPIASHSGAWGDFDNDGNVDLFVCGEFGTSDQDGLYPGAQTLSLSDSRNRCRLYRNRGDGTFVNVAETALVCNDRFAKGAAWGDYDADGFLDLYVSNFGGGNRLYHNRGDGTFEDVAPQLGLTKPEHSFSCWFWDFDNDGRLDLFVNDYSSDLQDAVASALGRPGSSENHPRLYRNLGAAGFRDVAPDVGLDRVMLAMGSNFGDIDNDGFLDFYLGTGLPGYSALIPNLLFKNVDGRRFEDVTSASGTGHLQKGHGVSFADCDSDGDLDLFVETGGAVPGDKAYNVLFANPGNGRHWLKLKLVGTKTNRAALGARIQVDLKQPDGTTRSIHRQVGGASSYGGNSLVEHIGLGDNTGRCHREDHLAGQPIAPDFSRHRRRSVHPSNRGDRIPSGLCTAEKSIAVKVLEHFGQSVTREGNLAVGRLLGVGFVAHGEIWDHLRRIGEPVVGDLPRQPEALHRALVDCRVQVVEIRLWECGDERIRFGVDCAEAMLFARKSVPVRVQVLLLCLGFEPRRELDAVSTTIALLEGLRVERRAVQRLMDVSHQVEDPAQRYGLVLLCYTDALDIVRMRAKRFGKVLDRIRVLHPDLRIVSVGANGNERKVDEVCVRVGQIMELRSWWA